MCWSLIVALYGVTFKIYGLLFISIMPYWYVVKRGRIWFGGLKWIISSINHATGTEIRYQDPSALPWSKMATATTGKDVYTAIVPRQQWLDLV